MYKHTETLVVSALTTHATIDCITGPHAFVVDLDWSKPGELHVRVEQPDAGHPWPSWDAVVALEETTGEPDDLREE